MSALPLASAPVDRRAHLFDVDGTPHLFLANGSRVYGLADDNASRVLAALKDTDAGHLDRLLFDFGLDAPPYIEAAAPTSFPTRALSLAVAQKCNLGCTYCYAQGGEFGGPARSMDHEIDRKSVV